MSINIFYSLIKLVGLYFCIGYAYFKILNAKNEHLTLIVTFLSILFSLINLVLQAFSYSFLVVIINCLIYNLFLSHISKSSYGVSLLIITVSISISYIMFSISSGFIAAIWAIFLPYKDSYIMYILVDICEITLVHLLFKIKRLKNGLPFLTNQCNNTFMDIFTIILSILIILVFFITTSYSRKSIFDWYIWMIFFSIPLVPIIQKTFILYQKQKLQTKTLKEYEQELEETKHKLSTALEEKQKLIKSNHEFYHRQEALNKKLDDLINQQKLSMNTEFAEDYRDLLSRINNLSDEYIAKTHTIPKLVKTNIIEIDDMLSYMQSECIKENIDFTLKVDCDINYILDNFISKSQLETLLGDLIRNAIIAINHSSNDYRSIMVVFGIKDDAYELCIFDSGIPFEIETLLNFGLKPASTHESEGGTGIGLITTSETIDCCNASLIINEITNNNYTKSIEIKFDNKHEYIIISDRSEDIDKMNDSKRNIITKKVIRE